MPKQRITKEMVINAAFQILHEKGEGEVLVKSIAAKLSCINNFDDLYASEANENMTFYLKNTLEISEESAKKLHMNMIIYNTGLSFMAISTGGNLPEQELNEKLNCAYETFLKLAKNEGAKI